MIMSEIKHIDIGDLPPYLVDQYMDLVIDYVKNNKPYPSPEVYFGKQTFWSKIKHKIKTWIWYGDFTSL